MLQSVGLATVQSGHGLYVKDLDIYELQEVRTSREALEVKAVWLLTEKASAEDISQLELINRNFEQAVMANDFKKAQPINKQFHKTILELCSNKFLLEMYQVIECHIDRYFVYAPIDNSIIKKTGVFSHFAVKQHDAIINGIKTCIPDIASAAMLNHINSAQAHIMPNLF
jgi:DNA-binding GntR family transcriptional regulator